MITEARRIRGAGARLRATPLVTSLAAPLALLLALTLASAGPAVGQTDGFDQVELVGQLPMRDGGNDIWGYSAPDGTEIAIMGTLSGTSFVDVTDPAAPREVAFIPGPGSIWRDIKTYQHYAYIVNENINGGGVQVVSLENPLEPALLNVRTAFFDRAHNLYVDEDAGVLWAAGARPGQNTFALSLEDPRSPSLLGSYSEYYLHDIYVQDGIAYGAAINQGILVTLDVSDPSAIATLDTARSANGATHNTWLTGDGKYCLTTDEVAGGHITVFDVSDPSEIRYVSEFQHPSDPTSIVHNVTVRDDVAFVSWYTSGLEVVDLSDPTQPQRLGFYDTYPGRGAYFNGVWGVYPFAASGLVYASDTSTGLYVFDFTGAHATIRVTVTDAETGEPLAGVGVDAGREEVLATDEEGQLDLRLPEGSHEVSIDHFGYVPLGQELTVVANEVRSLDLTLSRLPWGRVSGTLTQFESGDPARNVEVRLLETPRVTNVDGDGTFAFERVPEGTYELEAVLFGYQTAVFSLDVTAEAETVLDLPLLRSHVAYDMEEEDGWTVGALGDAATAGIWERIDPSASVIGEAQPAADHSVLGRYAFVTGSAVGSEEAGDHDVDGGATTLTTPVLDLSTLVHPAVRYHRWYSNDRGGNPGQDAFRVDVSSDGGETWTHLEELNESREFWEVVTFDLREYIAPTDAIVFRFIAEDDLGGSLIEAAIDDLEIFERQVVVVGEVTEATSGRPVPEAQVSFALTGRNPLAVQFGTDESGRFQALVQPGEQTLRVEAFGFEPYEEVLMLDRGRSLEIELAHMPRGVIAGTLTRDGSTAPVSGARVSLEGTPLSTLSDANGGFSFDDVPIGSYGVVVEHSAYATDRPVPVDVRAGESATVSVPLAALHPTALDRAFPNPFRGATTLALRLQDPEDVSLRIVDGSGRVVRTVHDGRLEAGTHELSFDGRDDDGRKLPAGVYFQVMQVEDRSDTGKLILVR